MPQSNTRSSRSCNSCSSTGTYACASNLERNSSILNVREKRSLPSEMIVMRHSERVDDVFNGWTKKAIKDGVYSPYDLNMPPSLPIKRPIENYSLDTPITVNGQVLAKMIGRGLFVLKKVPDVIYCSPSLRCLQTAHAVKTLSQSKAKLRVEPALFENPHLYRAMPTLATKEERAQFEVDERYQPLIRLKDLFAKEERIKSYNSRLKDVLLRIAATTEPSPDTTKPLTVLVVGHASTVDLAVGVLNPKQRQTTTDDLHRIGDRIPYCSTVLFRRQSSYWEPIPDALPPVTYRNFTNRVLHEFVYRTNE
ncbi:hypothetical protein PRIPAC_86580 [Pristionchus pacificus]|uniref:Uncharacterized protein n=1 Tax=Pristionchus pacificus TaxID=54126 RepID=A0A2A6BND7_PRIPA|nr:hypothetical protein PRIPAC_86580 [Pristionchus pacificus]|eukprot:PDM67348.1 hypothetical protein PRIPAC_48765 [Pristionchus pacificus]